MTDKVRENRLRRMAERQCKVIEKSRRRDPRAKDFGMYRLLDDSRDLQSARGIKPVEYRDLPFNKTLDEIEERLMAEGDGIGDH